MNFEHLQYENVFTKITKEKVNKKTVTTKQVFARLYNTKTKEVNIVDVTNYSIPNIYLPSNTKTQYKSYVDESPLSKKSFRSFQELDKFTKNIKKETGNDVTIETDDGEIFTFPEKVFDEKAHGYLNERHTFIHRCFIDSVSSDHEPRTWILDIETRSGQVRPGEFPHANAAWEEITMIQIYDNITDMYYVLGRKKFTGEFELSNAKFIYIPKEEDLLEFFIRMLEKHKPGVITTWNGFTFDISYLTNRIARVLDNFDGSVDELNKKNSYKDMTNVSRLSPIGQVLGKPKVETKDGMTGVTSLWSGILLLDYKELAIKYGWLNVPSYSLNNFAKALGLSQKIDHSTYSDWDNFYTAKGYIFPTEITPEIEADEVYQVQRAYKDGKCTWEEVEQVVYNRFVEYSIRDVEILKQAEDKVHYLATHRSIAYLCGVTQDDNWNTLSHWQSLMYKEAYKEGTVLPLIQHNHKFNTTFLAGWVRTVPGKYKYISSFDFASLYPSLIRTWNIGGDTYIPYEELPKELQELRDKYFTYYDAINLNRFNVEVNDYKKTLYYDDNGEIVDSPSEEDIKNKIVHTKPKELGNLVKKYDDEINDIQEETDYFLSLIENKDIIETVLKKYNVTATPNGYFYTKEKQSILSKQMETIFNNRIMHKHKAQEIYDKMEELDKDSLEYISLKEEMVNHDLMSNSLKLLMNSIYGGTSMKYNTFSNGNVTASSITSAGRFSNKIASLRCSQEVQRIISEEVTNELKYIPQSDTDSLYLNVDKILMLPKFKDLDEDTKIKFILKISSTKFQDVINKSISVCNNTLNVMNKKVLTMENEVITSGFVSIGLKRYFARLVVKDGTILEKPKLKIVGLDLVKKGMTQYIKDHLKPVLDLILDKDIQDLRDYIRDVKEDFRNTSIVNFCRQVNVNALDYMWTGEKYHKFKNDKYLTAPINSVASLEFNRYIKEHNLTGKFNEIERGETIKYVYTLEPNNKKVYKAIAWKDDQFVIDEKIDSIVDRDTHFEKDFLEKVNIVAKSINWDIKQEAQELSVW